MSALFSTVWAAWQMKCPKCRADNQIDITAMIDVRLTPTGTDADESEDGNHYWEDTYQAKCCQCGHRGTVKDFRG
jgi:hypothetical protein